MKNKGSRLTRYKSSLVIFLMITTVFSSASTIFGNGVNPLDNGFEVTVFTDQDAYYRDETVTITGQLTEDGIGILYGVCINITDPEGTGVVGICTGTNETGYYTFPFVLSPDSPLGEYHVHVKKSDDPTVFADTYFDVVTSELLVDINGPYNGKPDQEIQFQSTVSGGKQPYTYLWEFGDDTTATIPQPTHIYSENGTYLVNLTVWDNGTLQTMDSTIAVISNYSLSVETDQLYYYPGEKLRVTGQLLRDGEGQPGEQITITITDPEENTSTLFFPFTDMNGMFSSTIVLPSDAILGQYEVEAYHQVSDTPAYSMFHVVSSILVVDTTGPYEGLVNEDVDMSGAVSGGKPPYTFFWDFGDDSNATGQEVSHIYTGAGTYNIFLQVTDAGVAQGNTTTTATISEQTGYTHQVLIEYGSYTTCEPCVTTSNQLYDLYQSGNHDFSYVSLIVDENTDAEQRGDQLGMDLAPDVYYDGGFTHVFGEQSSLSPYINALDDSGARDVADITLVLNVTWLGEGAIQITGEIENNDAQPYNGTLRLYMVEPLSRYLNYDNEPYHFGTLDIITTEVTIDETYVINITWDGEDQGFSEVCENNIMVVAAVFAQGSTFVDETTSAIPAPSLAISIVNPTTGLYFKGSKIRDYFLRQRPVILGNITVTVDAVSCGSELDRVRFYVDDELQDTDSSSPYEWSWTKRYLLFFGHTLKVEAEDIDGNVASDEIRVWKIW